MADGINSLLIELQELVSKLEIIGFGGNNDSVTHNGVTRGTLMKSINDEIAAQWVAIASLSQSRNVVETFPELPAVGDGTVMYDVWNDLIATRNGLYGWSGGAWVKSPFDVNRSALDSNRRTGKHWLAAAKTHDFNDHSHGPSIVAAILAVRGIGVELLDTYRIGVFAHNDATHKDRIIVSSAGTSSGWDTGVVTVPDKLNGPVWVVAVKSNGTRFELLIDYSLLVGHDGVLHNSSNPYFELSSHVLVDGDQVARIETHDQELSSHAQQIVDAKSVAVDVQRNRVFRALSSSIIANADYLELVECFQSYYLHDLPREGSYRVNVFQYSIPSETSKVWVKDNNDVQYHWEGSLNDSGFQTVELVGSAGRVSVLLDLNVLTKNKIYVNSTATPFVFNGNESSATELAVFMRKNSFPFIDQGRLNFSKSAYVAIAEAIVGARVLKGDEQSDYSIGVFANKDSLYNNDLWIKSGEVTVAKIVGAGFSPSETGITRVVVPEYQGSGVEIELFIDYSKLADRTGVLVNGGRIWLKMGVASIPALVVDQVARADAELRRDISTLVSGSTQKNLKVSLLGSSTTWGKGYLGKESYVEGVEDYLRNKLATTISASQLSATGTWQLLANEPMCYQSSIGKLSGVGASVNFELHGDEVSVALCKERGNSGSSVVELLVDGVVHDTFSTHNTLPFGSDVFNTVGDGSSKTFDLGRAFTYGHVVTFDSVDKTGRMNQGGYGGSGGFGDDVWMIVRKLVSLGSGEYEVRHFLTFETAPDIGVVVQCNYNYGESIKPTLSTVGNLLAGIGSDLESVYGEGSTVHDPANPVGLSSGLDFRQNDSRAVKTWRFSNSASRKYQLRIKSVDSRASGLTPDLFIGFVTNRMHYVQNAGIGGYKASNFLQTNNLTNLRQVASFKPDFAFIKLAANDDWDVHEFKAWLPKTGVTDADLRASDSSMYLKTISGSGENYSVDDSRCPIVAITPFSVTFDSAVQLGAVVPGDQIVLGDYKGDNRRVVVRVVEGWAGKTATFKQELLAADLVHISSLSDLIGTTAQVKSIYAWDQNIRNMITQLKDTLPALNIGLSTDGLPNYNMRRLEGYAEAAEGIAGSIPDVDYVDAYGVTKRWTYDQNQNISVYLDASQGTVSTAAAEYPLFKSDGAIWAYRAPRNLSVKVDGIERINDGCHVSGGEKKGWPDTVVTMTTSNAVTVIDQQVLVFTSNVPAADAVIEVSYSSSKWSSDDTHPGTVGNKLFAAVAVDTLSRNI